MYSGTTLNQKSGRVIGVHQKIDRQARRTLHPLIDDNYFPNIKNILHFEGKNGPDGIKRKAPSQDELWHFIDPNNLNDAKLFSIIKDHQTNLIAALKNKDEQRGAFEAAWLAHAVVDGLTPAHHYPLEKKLTATLGKGIDTRTTIAKKIILPGASARSKLRNNWEYWGAKGVLTSHYLFEFGVASAVAPLKIIKTDLSKKDIQRLNELGFETIFRRNLASIHSLAMFETFYRIGWTTKLARQTRNQLVPLIVQTVALAWLECIYRARR